MSIFVGQKCIPLGLSAQLGSKDKTISQLQQQVSQLTHFKVDEAVAREQVKARKRDFELISQAVDQAHREEANLKKRLQALQREHIQHEMSMESTIQTNITERVKAEKELTRLESKLKEQREASKDLSEKLNYWLIKNSQQHQNIQTIKQERDRLRSAKQGLVQECETMEQSLNDLTNECTGTSERREAAQKNSEMLQSRLNYVKQEQERAKERQKETNNSYHALKENKHTSEAEAKSLKKELDAFKEVTRVSNIKQIKEKIRAVGQTNCCLLASIKYAGQCTNDLIGLISSQEDHFVNSNTRKADLAELNHHLRQQIADQKLSANLLNKRYMAIKQGYNKSRECERALRRILDERSLNEQPN